jgi:CO dehydrogenase maturation factor
MKLSVCGKGGSGKSTIVSLLAGEAGSRGYRVLVVDSDESNSSLYRMLGFNRPPVSLMDSLGGKPGLKAKMSNPSIFLENEIYIDNIPAQHILEQDGIMLVSIGKILQSLEGCACPMGVLSREFLKKLTLREGEIVIVDMEAGIEHFGRGIEASLDSVLIVTEPSFESLELSEKIRNLAAGSGINNISAILNKITSREMAEKLSDKLAERNIAVIGSIYQDAGISDSNLEGNPVKDLRINNNVREILDRILDKRSPGKF